jgi:hypothetical protein
VRVKDEFRGEDAVTARADPACEQDKPAGERVLRGLERPGPYANAALAEAMREAKGH